MRFYVPVTGFHWEKVTSDESNTDKLLGINPPTENEGLVFNEFVLNKHPMAFLAFARLTLNEKSILSAVNQFGLLKAPPNEQVLYHALCVTPENSRLKRWLEPFALWRSEIVEMRRMVDLWELVRDNQLKKVQKHFVINGEEAWFNVSDRWGMRRERLFIDDVLASRRVIGNDYYRLARAVIANIVNEKLSSGMAPRLELYKGSVMSLLVEPRNLLGALWYQFAQYVAKRGSQTYAVCRICGKPFLAQRPNRSAYCGVTCKKRAYRQRQRDADVSIESEE